MLELKFKPNRNKLAIEDAVINTVGNDYNYAEEKLKILKEVPQIYYYNQEFPMQYVSKLEINSNEFLPTLHVIFNDVYNIIHDIGFPGDNAKVTVILPSDCINLADIFLEFKITNFYVDPIKNNTNKKIEMFGVLNVENILIKNYESFNNSTSYEVCKKLCQEIGLGFMSNVGNSQDKMNWLNPGKHRYKFIQENVLKYAWLGETGFAWSFVDFYYNLNYVNVEKALNEDIKNIIWLIKPDGYDEVTETEPVLTNELSIKDTNMFFIGEKVRNNSTKTSLDRGYLRNISYYDVDGNWSEKAGSYKEYALDTITSPDGDNVVYLKGEPNDTTFYNNNQSFHWLGKIDTVNMHPDYLWAKKQNEENLYDLQKISINITLPHQNFNLRKFEKVKLMFVNPNINAGERGRNLSLNGEWLVIGIKFEWIKGNYIQKVSLVKRELTYNE